MNVTGAKEIGANAFNILAVWRGRKHEDQIAGLVSSGNAGETSALRQQRTCRRVAGAAGIGVRWVVRPAGKARSWHFPVISTKTQRAGWRDLLFSTMGRRWWKQGLSAPRFAFRSRRRKGANAIDLLFQPSRPERSLRLLDSPARHSSLRMDRLTASAAPPAFEAERRQQHLTCSAVSSSRERVKAVLAFDPEREAAPGDGHGTVGRFHPAPS